MEGWDLWAHIYLYAHKGGNSHRRKLIREIRSARRFVALVHPIHPFIFLYKTIIRPSLLRHFPPSLSSFILFLWSYFVNSVHFLPFRIKFCHSYCAKYAYLLNGDSWGIIQLIGTLTNKCFTFFVIIPSKYVANLPRLFETLPYRIYLDANCVRSVRI